MEGGNQEFCLSKLFKMSFTAPVEREWVYND